MTVGGLLRQLPKVSSIQDAGASACYVPFSASWASASNSCSVFSTEAMAIRTLARTGSPSVALSSSSATASIKMHCPGSAFCFSPIAFSCAPCRVATHNSQPKMDALPNPPTEQTQHGHHATRSGPHPNLWFGTGVVRGLFILTRHDNSLGRGLPAPAAQAPNRPSSSRAVSAAAPWV